MTFEIENNNLYHCSTLSLSKILSEGSKKRWKAISIEGHNICNLDCKMCPYSKMTRKKELMSMELYTKIIDDCVEFGIELVNLSLYNEPLLDKYLFERIKYAKEKGLKVGFYCNATLLTKEKSKKLLDSGIDYINFSFDGATKESYEKIRKNANFKITRANIINFAIETQKRLLRELPYPIISVMLTAQDENYTELKEFEEFWKSVVDFVGISQFDNRKGTDRSKVEKNLTYPCRLLCSGGIVIMSNGKVPLCCKDYDGSISLGDLNTQTLEDIWNSKFKTYKTLHLDGKGNMINICKNCDDIYSGFSWWMDLPIVKNTLSKLVKIKLKNKKL
jgi:radical SAM protein with 4Fe4S-binding SPASM domain